MKRMKLYWELDAREKLNRVKKIIAVIPLILILAIPKLHHPEVAVLCLLALLVTVIEYTYLKKKIK